jgi:hypothetical protein
MKRLIISVVFLILSSLTSGEHAIYALGERKTAKN